MSTVADLKQAVCQLSADQLTAFQVWFEEYTADLWDQQIARDLKAGKLDRLIAEAQADIAARRATPL